MSQTGDSDTYGCRVEGHWLLIRLSIRLSDLTTKLITEDSNEVEGLNVRVHARLVSQHTFPTQACMVKSGIRPGRFKLLAIARMPSPRQ